MAVARDPATARLAALSAATSIYYAGAAIAVHWLNPALSPIRNYISDYAVGAHGAVYVSAYWATVAGCLALAVAIIRQMGGQRRARAGAALIAVFGLTYAVTAIFPTEILPPGAFPRGAAGIIHALAALVGWIATMAAVLVLAKAFARVAEHRRLTRTLAGLAWLMAAALVGLVVVVGSRQPLAGLAEKTFIAFREAWLLLAAVGICRVAGGLNAVLAGTGSSGAR